MLILASKGEANQLISFTTYGPQTSIIFISYGSSSTLQLFEDTVALFDLVWSLKLEQRHHTNCQLGLSMRAKVLKCYCLL